jgi:hypothetical protein
MPVVQSRTDAVDKLIDKIVALRGVDRLSTRLDELTTPAAAAE